MVVVVADGVVMAAVVAEEVAVVDGVVMAVAVAVAAGVENRADTKTESNTAPIAAWDRHIAI